MSDIGRAPRGEQAAAGDAGAARGDPPPTLTRALAVGAWAGLVAGWAESVVTALRRLWIPGIASLGPDAVWLAPTGAALLAAACAALAWLAARRLKSARAQTGIVVFGAATPALLGPLCLVPYVAQWASLALAAGVAAQFARRAAGSATPVAAPGGLVRRTLPWLVASVVVTGAGGHALRAYAESRARAALPPAVPGAKNVLFVTLDTVRAADVGLLGYERATTPNIERLAAGGATFERAVSAASWTLTSHASMFTGRWPHELSSRIDTPLDATYPTLAEFLAGRGYATGGFVANLTYCGRNTGLDRGFVHFDDQRLTLGLLVESTAVLRRIADNFRLRALIGNDQHLCRRSAEDLRVAVESWVDENRDRPFFAFVNIFDAHEPYLPPPPFDRRFGPGRARPGASPLRHWLWDPAVAHAPMGDAAVREERDAYDGGIAYADEQLGELLAGLERRGILRDTLVVVTADHGEEFGEHGLFEHGYSLYFRSVHVPLVISFPPAVPAGVRVAGGVTLRDLAATVADLLAPGEASPFPGTSLARTWRAPAGAPPRAEPLLSETEKMAGQPEWFPTSHGGLQSVTRGTLRYIRRDDGVEELFDLATDPGETKNLSNDAAHAASLDAMRSELGRLTAR